MSNIKFAFDPELEPGQRILVSSVLIGGQPIDINNGRYTVATKAYLRSGKDGFDALKHAKVIVDGETAPRLATLVHYLLTRIEELNQQRPPPCCDNSDGIDNATHNSNVQQEVELDLMPVCNGPQKTEACAHGLDALYYYDAASCSYGIAPMSEQRISILSGSKNGSNSGISTTSNGSSTSRSALLEQTSKPAAH